MKEKQIKESKQQIQSLAGQCINKIYENKFLKNQKERYIEQIIFIKTILKNNSKSENNDIDVSLKNLVLIEQIKKFYKSLISSNLQLKNDNEKVLTKLNSYKGEIINEDSLNKQTLANKKYDNFLLTYSLKEKDYILKGLNKSLEITKQNLYFKENKREIQVNNKWGEYYLKVNLNDLSEKMMEQCQNFIQYRNKCDKKEKEKTKIKKKIEFYNEIIKYYKSFINEENLYNNNFIIKNGYTKNKNKKSSKNKKLIMAKSIILPNDNKLSLFDNKDNIFNENLLIDEEKKNNEDEDNSDNNKNILEDNEQAYFSTFIDNNNYENLFKYKSNEVNNINYNKNKNKNKNSSKSIKNFLTIDELFDINNHEGKEEAIIDEELHSDDETVFETKVKPLKKITIHYIPNIKKQIPKINLSQIEFNKQKVMNEADLYSLQRRKYKMQNMDENIKTMKKKIKKLKHICKLNKKKLNAFENYAKNMENNYKALKPLKIQSSLGGVKIPKIQNFFKDGGDKNNFINGINDIDLGDDYIDNIEEDEIYDVSNTETNAGTRISISDKNNILINNKYVDNLLNQDVNLKKKESRKKITQNNNKSTARANSK